MSNRTREETERALRDNTRKVPGGVAKTILTDPEFQKFLNRYMFSTHVQWALTLAILFIGINYSVIWVTEAFHIGSLVIAVILTPIGIVGVLWQAITNREPKQAKQ